MKSYPALDVRTDDPDLLYPVLDDFAPTAIEERTSGLRAFFTSAEARDAAMAGLAGQLDAVSVDVPDEDWARRSQQNLQPITVGRIVINPGPQLETAAALPSAVVDRLTITIVPSMGFGTGHHATTRLCLAALQEIGVAGKTVLDVGTGSGVLAFAAARLGATRAIGIDVDPDAIQAARENVPLNPDAAQIGFELADLATTSLPAADVVTANLTGALLIRSAEQLVAAVSSGGTLILSGLMREERDAVCAAFGAAPLVWERHEDEWVGLGVKKP